MKAFKGQAYFCDHCNKPYPLTSIGLEMANACCICRECGTSNVSYVGVPGTLCCSCYGEQELKAAEYAFEHARKHLELWKKKVEKA